MARFSWRKWFGFETNLSRRDELRRRCRPRLEHLEDRTLPSATLVAQLNPDAAGSNPTAPFALANGQLLIEGEGVSALFASGGTPSTTTPLATVASANIPAFGGYNSDLPVTLNGVTYLAASDPATGQWELYQTDGTVAGTGPVTSAVNGVLYNPVLYNGELYFTGSDPATGQYGLYKSDGTAAGTSLLSGGLQQIYSSLVLVNGQLYFMAHTSSSGEQLYQSSGGTAALAFPSLQAVGVQGSTGSALYFVALDPSTNQYGLYQSSGGAPVLLSTSVASAYDFTAVGSTTYFLDGSGTQLYQTDGTAAGTALVASGLSNTQGLTSLNGTLYFSASDAAHGQELWQYTPGSGATLAADIDPGAGSSSPQYLTVLGNSLYFAASTGPTGQELWQYTPASGASLAADINSGLFSSYPSNLTAIGNALYLSADDGVHGQEPWKYVPGAGASLVANLDQDTAGSYPTAPFALANGQVLFEANTASGRGGKAGSVSALFASGGTPATTTPLAVVGSEGIFLPVTLNGVTYFAASDPATFLSELYRSDGTVAGTGPVTSAVSGVFYDPVLYNGALYFTGSDQAKGQYGLYKSDGTAAGTSLLSGGLQQVYSSLVAVNGQLYFWAYTSASGEQLYQSSGGAAVALAFPGLQIANPGGSTGNALYFSAYSPSGQIGLYQTSGGAPVLLSTSVASAYDFTALGSTTYFLDGSGTQLYQTDGTAAGTALVASGLSNPQWLTGLNGSLYFSASDAAHGQELWQYTPGSGASLAADINPGAGGSSPQYLTVLGNTLYFAASTGPTGQELWQYTPGSGASLAADINPGPLSSNPENLTAIGNALYLSADDGVHGQEPWEYVPGVGASLVANLNQEPETGFVNKQAGGTNPLTPFALANGQVVFEADIYNAPSTGAKGSVVSALFSSGRTPATTTPLAVVGLVNIPSSGGYNSNLPVTLNGVTYLAASTGQWELYQTDGTVAGTGPVTSAVNGVLSNPVLYNGALYFTGSDPAKGQWGLYRSDGTAAGTSLVSGGLQQVQSVVAVNGQLYFEGSSSSSGEQLYQSSGGTAALAFPSLQDVGVQGSTGSALYFVALDPSTNQYGLYQSSGGAPVLLSTSVTSAYDFTAVGSTTYFLDGSGTQLYQTDGTAAGTALVASGLSNPQWLTGLNGSLYFSASDAAHGQELWQYTPGAGARLAADINPGAGSSNPSYLTVLGNALYFAASTGPTAQELWQYTPASGASLAADINPGPLSSNPSTLTAIGNTLYVSADDGTGQALWKYTTSSDTATSVTPSNPAPVYGTSVTVTAMVSGIGIGAGTPTGTVQFQVDGVNVGSPITLVNGQATSGPLSLGAGVHTITASYTSDSGLFVGGSGGVSGFAVGKAAPTVQASDAGGTSNGGPFPATATVNGGSTLESVGPTLSYYSGTYTSPAQLAGLTSLGGAPTAAGSYTVLAAFAGSADYSPATGLANFSIKPPPPPTAHLTSPTVLQSAGSTTVGFTLTASDPTPALQAGSFTYIINWGDNTSQTVTATRTSGSLTHAYTAANEYTVSVTAQDQGGAVSALATATVVVSTAAGDHLTLEDPTLAAGQPAGAVWVTWNSTTTTYQPTDQVVVAGLGGRDVYTVDFGQLLVPVAVAAGGLTSGDKLVVNGVPNTTTNRITKTAGAAQGQGTITWTDGSPTTVTEGITFVGVPKVTINANGTKTNYVKDPGDETTINGGPGANIIEITATSGDGVVINGGPSNNTYIIDLGSLAGPVVIQNSNAGATDSLIVNGASGDNSITVAGDQVTEGAQTITDTASLANLTVNGGSGNNQFTVSALTVPVQDFTLAGGGGTNTYNVNAGAVNIVAGAGVNVLNVTGGTVASITAPAGDTQPLVFAHSYTVLDNGTLSVPANGVLASDVSANGQALTAVLPSGPAHGTLNLKTDGSFTYTPAANFVGSDSFTYQAKGSDGTLSAAAPVTIQVSYHFGGFLAPLNSNIALALNRTVPIKFQLTDYNNKSISSLSAVNSFQVLNAQGQNVLTNAGSTALRYDSTANQFIANWQTKGLPAGTYTVTLVLNDGTTYTKTVQLSANGSNAALLVDGASPASTAVGALLGGDIELYVDNSNGDLTADELARIQDAVTAVDAVTEPYGVAVQEVTDPTLADVTLTMDTTSAVGGYADGVLGCTTDAGQITLITGWDFYAGSDTTQVGSGQYDFETVVTHELGHALGLGHSTDGTSVMYATLNTGTVNRSLTTADLNVPDSDATGVCGLHAVSRPAEGMERAGAANPMVTPTSRDLVFAALASEGLGGPHGGLPSAFGPGMTVILDAASTGGQRPGRDGLREFGVVSLAGGHEAAIDGTNTFDLIPFFEADPVPAENSQLFDLAPFFDTAATPAANSQPFERHLDVNDATARLFAATPNPLSRDGAMIQAWPQIEWSTADHAMAPDVAAVDATESPDGLTPVLALAGLLVVMQENALEAANPRHRRQRPI